MLNKLYNQEINKLNKARESDYYIKDTTASQPKKFHKAKKEKDDGEVQPPTNIENVLEMKPSSDSLIQSIIVPTFFMCCQCSALFNSELELQTHVSSRSHMCQFCNILYCTKELCESHIQNIHHKWCCQYCNLVFPSSDEVTQHLITECTGVLSLFSTLEKIVYQNIPEEFDLLNFLNSSNQTGDTGQILDNITGNNQIFQKDEPEATSKRQSFPSVDTSSKEVLDNMETSADQMVVNNNEKSMLINPNSHFESCINLENPVSLDIPTVTMNAIPLLNSIQNFTVSNYQEQVNEPEQNITLLNYSLLNSTEVICNDRIQLQQNESMPLQLEQQEPTALQLQQQKTAELQMEEESTEGIMTMNDLLADPLQDSHDIQKKESQNDFANLTNSVDDETNIGINSSDVFHINPNNNEKTLGDIFSTNDLPLLPKSMLPKGGIISNIHEQTMKGKQVKTVTKDRTNSFNCDSCGKIFTTKQNLTFHKRTHDNNYPYTCQTCGQKLRYLQQVKEHEVLHSGEKPYQCDQCGKTYTRKRDLQRHGKTHNPEKHECPICGKTFTRLSTLQNNHLPTHVVDTKEYSCNQCSKKFKNSICLDHHMKSHKIFDKNTCNICNKEFKSKKNLRSHLERHSKWKDYIKCPQCCKKFSSQENVDIHVKKFHQSSRKTGVSKKSNPGKVIEIDPTLLQVECVKNLLDTDSLVDNIDFIHIMSTEDSDESQG